MLNAFIWGAIVLVGGSALAIWNFGYNWVAIGSFIAAGILTAFIMLLSAGVKWAVETAVFLRLPGNLEIEEEMRTVVERFGKFFEVLEQGPHWLPPGVRKVRYSISLQDQTIPLYRNAAGHPERMDLKDGSVGALGAEVVVRIHSADTPYDVNGDGNHTGVYRAIYFSGNWRQEIEDAVDPVLSGYITSLSSVDDLLALSTYEFWTSGHIPSADRAQLEEAVRRIGFDILRIQVRNFEESAEARRAREEVNRRKREREGAEELAEQRAIEIVGTYVNTQVKATGKTVAQIQGEIASNPAAKKELEEFAKDAIRREISAGAGALKDFRVEGLDIAGIIAAALSGSGGRNP